MNFLKCTEKSFPLRTIQAPCYTSLAKFLLLLLLVSQVHGFGRPRKHNRKFSERTSRDCNSSGPAGNPSTDKPNEPTESPTKPEIINYDPYYNCGLVGFGYVQKIPYKTTSAHDPIEVNFSSACLRCGLCLAIAENMNQTLIEVHDLLPSGQWLKDDEARLLFGFICNEQFKHYALREIDGKRYIGNSLPGAILIATTADGNWEMTLKKRCYDILDEMGSEKLYRHWLDWCNGSSDVFGDFICRGEYGRLRDCRSIGGDGKDPEVCQNTYYAGIKVKAELG